VAVLAASPQLLLLYRPKTGSVPHNHLPRDQLSSPADRTRPFCLLDARAGENRKIPGHVRFGLQRHRCSFSQEPARLLGKTAAPGHRLGSPSAPAGDNGWCKGGAAFEPVCSEPLSGYSITARISTLGMLCSTSGSDVNCSWPFPEGSTFAQLLGRISSYGDTSTMALLR